MMSLTILLTFIKFIEAIQTVKNVTVIFIISNTVFHF